MCQNRFQSITRERLDLPKFGPHVHPGQQRNPISKMISFFMHCQVEYCTVNL